MGAQKDDSGAPNYDPAAEHNEGPVHEVTLDWFFLAKHELGQAQWALLTGGERPSLTQPGSDPTLTLRSPVEQVSWLDCDRVLRRHGLVLPTEAQWEYAARAGTSSVWPTGNAPQDLEGFANLAQRAQIKDEFRWSAPIDSLRPNAWGLHHVCGNVHEWVRDPFVRGPSYAATALDPKDGMRATPDRGRRAIRGGSGAQNAVRCRSAARASALVHYTAPDLGVRAARTVD
jgi:formylglycine-generating enzyme required for sulfatase activity